MDREVMLKCTTCDSDPFLASTVSPNTGKTLSHFHTNQGHTVVEYNPDIHNKKEPALITCVDAELNSWFLGNNADVDPSEKDRFLKTLRNDRFLLHHTVGNKELLILDKEIKVMRPITLIDGTRYILTYLPTQITDTRGKLSRQNRAFFIRKTT